MEQQKRFFTLGVAYYPDYLYAGQKARLASGKIAALSVEDRIRVDFERMRKDGISLARVGEFSWAHVEPEPGVYYTERFNHALDLAREYGIQVMFCTPTATPPKWLSDQDPSILAVTRAGKTIPFGGRRHYDPLSPSFREQSQRITEVYAKAFGKHPAVTAWQTDNELGNHTSSRSFTHAAALRFRDFLKARYGNNIEQLNEAWFTCFWSQHYRSFAELELPVETWTDPNPAQELDYRRFMSKAYRDFQAEQIAVIKAHSPGRPITHNITPMFFDLCLWDLTEDLDVAGYDHYQMGPTPDPLSSASQYNLMRSLKPDHKFLVLEQQPVQVNWQPVNGRFGIDWLFLWGMQAACLGASTMCYFSWQRFYGGSEQYHDGVVPHDLRVPRSRQEQILEAKAHVFQTLQKHFQLTELPLPSCEVLMVHNSESMWAHEICSQTRLWDGIKIAEELQAPFLSQGIGVNMTPDLTTAAPSLHRYKLLVLPGYAFEFSDEEIAILRRFIAQGGSVLSLPRTAMKDQANRMSQFPLRLFDEGDFYFAEHGALLENEREEVYLAASNTKLTGKIWAENLVIQNHARWQTLAHFRGGLYHDAPAIIKSKPEAGHGSYVHLAFCPVVDQAFVTALRTLFGLQPTLSAPLASPVQSYSFAEGSRRFVAALNFGTKDEALTLNAAALAPHASKLVAYTAALNSDLSLREHHSNVPLVAGEDTALNLPGRTFGVWEAR